MSTDPVKAAIPLGYAQIAWAKEFIVRSFGLQRADDIISRELCGVSAILGTLWFIRTYVIGVYIFNTRDLGSIDLDFDKPDPDPWRMQIFIERRVNHGNLPYEPYRELINDEGRMKQTIESALSGDV
jgi:hypothetical protein